MTAIQRFKVTKAGAPDALEWTSEDLTGPGEGAVQIKHEAVGVNYIDIYHRAGTYPLPLPTGIGVEGAGVIEAVGAGVTGFAVGDRVAYVGGPPGAYATARHVPAGRVVKLPADVSAQTAASLIFKGLTVEYLIRRCYTVKAGETVVFHAAAGGVGSIATQWLKHIGATVIGIVSSEEKAKIAKANGADHAIVSKGGDFLQQVKDITGGKGVPVVYDSVGKDTYMASLDCLASRGTLVSFGISSGQIPPIDTGMLTAKGSLYITRPSIAHYTAKREELDAAAAVFFEMLKKGVIKQPAPKAYALKDAAKAHADMEGRATSGSVILTP